MALDRYPGVRREIWRYLRDEERIILSRMLPGVKFSEPDAKVISTQHLAEFAARTGWLDALELFRRSVDIDEILIASMECNAFEPTQFALDHGADDFSGALLEAARHGNLPKMLAMKQRGATNFEPTYLEAVFGGNTSAIDLVGTWH